MNNLDPRKKIFVFLILAFVLVLLTATWAMKAQGERTTSFFCRQSAEMVYRSQRPFLLANNVAQAKQVCTDLTGEGGLTKVLIVGRSNKILASSAGDEVGKVVSPKDKLCLSCHASGSKPPDFVCFSTEDRKDLRALLVLRNEKGCIQCHSQAQKKLGVIEVDYPAREISKVLVPGQVGIGATAGLALLFLGLLGYSAYMKAVRVPEDLSREVELQQKRLLRINEELENANRLKSEFLMTMSHELRTPLNSIIGFSEILMDKAPDRIAPELMKEFLENINISSRDLLSLVNGILDLTKVEAGRLDLYYETFAVPQILNLMKSIVESLAAKKEITLAVNAEENLPLLTCDLGRFKQILHNLLSNAIKFTREGGKITITASRNEEFLQFSVADTGMGIKEEDKERIFEAFQQAESFQARLHGGAGLGLTLCKRFVEMLGGRIWVDSTVGKGSTFSFLLPIKAKGKRVAESIALVEGKGRERRPIFPPGEKPLVLVVEDERRTSEMLKVILEEEGYEVSQAFDGAEAVRKAKELRPSAITLDILLPERSGWNVLSDLKAMPDTCDTPVLIVSVLRDKESKSRALSMGATDYFVKPLQGEEFRARIRKEIFTRKLKKEEIVALVVDDDPNTLTLMDNILKDEGIQTLKSLTGAEALTLLKEKKPQFVILDLLLPDMSGFDLLKTIRGDEALKDIHVLVLTGKELTEAERKLLDEHVDLLIRKAEFSRGELIERLRSMGVPGRAG